MLSFLVGVPQRHPDNLLDLQIAVGNPFGKVPQR